MSICLLFDKLITIRLKKKLCFSFIRCFYFYIRVVIYCIIVGAVVCVPGDTYFTVYENKLTTVDFFTHSVFFFCRAPRSFFTRFFSLINLVISIRYL